MSYTDRVGDRLKAIGQLLGSPFVLDDKGLLVLTYADGQSCTLSVLDAFREIMMYAPVAAVHSAVREPLFEASLRYNAVDGHPLDDFLGYDRDRRQLVLAARFCNDDPSVEDLSAALSTFLKSALAVRKELEDAVRAYTPARSSAPAAGTMRP